MLLALNAMSENQHSLEGDRQKVYNRYKSFKLQVSDCVTHVGTLTSTIL